MEIKHVTGKKNRNIMLYALSTCAWCRKTKSFLDDLGLEYRFIFVDQLEGHIKKEVMGEVERWNPSRSFPTIVVNKKECIVGFKEDRIREVVGHG